MALGVLAVILLVIIIMALSGRQQVPWSSKMRRLHAGSANRASWIAPEIIVHHVQNDYLDTMGWLTESVFFSWSQQWLTAPTHLSGSFLGRYQEILADYRTAKPPLYVGVLRCTHDVEVCEFSDDGEKCLVIDRQTSQRMATYDYQTHDRINTQDLGDGVVVYMMAYDHEDKRWKIDRHIQELPLSWRTGKKSRHLRLLVAPPPAVGRYN